MNDAAAAGTSSKDYEMATKRVYRLKMRLRFKRWSVENWLKGYKFGPVQRFRCCDHTTPHHYQACARG